MGDLIRLFRKPGGIAAIVIIAAVVAAGGYYSYGLRIKSMNAPAPAGQPAAQVNTIKKPQLLRTGYVGRAVLTPISTDYSGRITAVYVKEGQAVKAGQPLVKLEAKDVAASASASQQAAASKQGQDSYENALKEYSRFKYLYEQGAIPRRQLENAAARLQAAREQQDSGRGQGVTTVVQGPVTIQAPVDGMIAGLTVAPGSMVQAGQQLMDLGSGQTLEAVIPLEQSELYLIHLGDPASIETAGQTITGQVSSIYPEVQGNSLSFRAHIKLINPPAGLLKPGMQVNVGIDIEK